MKKVSTVVRNESRNLSQPKLTSGLDLGDRSSWYCVQKFKNFTVRKSVIAMRSERHFGLDNRGDVFQIADRELACMRQIGKELYGV